MFPIAYISQIQMRRTLAGARASDPVVPERRRRPRRAARTSGAQSRGLSPQAGCAPASTSGASA